MAIQKTEVIVLRTIPFRSSSLIVTFFSEQFGKLKGIVKGVRVERDMRGACYELFSHLEIVFYEKTRSDLHLISDAFIMESNDSLRTRLDTIAFASYFCELVDALTEVHDPHPELFKALLTCFHYLRSLPAEKVARIFEIRLLDEVGWLPHLDGCLVCGKPLAGETYFSVVQGAAACRVCAARFPDARPISPESLESLRFFLTRDIETAIRHRLAPAAEAGLGRLTDLFLRYRLSSPLKSRRFLQSIKPII